MPRLRSSSPLIINAGTAGKRAALWGCASLVIAFAAACSSGGGGRYIPPADAFTIGATDGPMTVMTNNDMGTAGCTVGLIMCSGDCTNILTDINNCGGCGHACGNGQLCSNGLCGSSCTNGEQLCNGQCTSTASDVNNCGACGTVCANGQVCEGECVCLTGVLCNSGCVVTTSDVNNCGGCNHVCANGQTCVSSVCTTPVTKTGCNGLVTCVNNCNGDANCETTCDSNATAQAINLFNTVVTCLNTACPTTNGGICDTTSANYNETNCDNCFSGAQAANGACVTPLNNCLNNGP